MTANKIQPTQPLTLMNDYCKISEIMTSSNTTTVITAIVAFFTPRLVLPLALTSEVSSSSSNMVYARTWLRWCKPWALESSLGKDDQDTDDPTDNHNRPWTGRVKKNSSKQDHTGLAALQFAQLEVCLWQFLGEYLDDQLPGGDSGHSDGNSDIEDEVASTNPAKRK
ncbi:hypothetical protein BDN67DRAFT_985204 [Paxillus ammoniavirescens]|nr:hypothetical protein BDN67DRAFT_985204 [Paxillus ammoniavirescens]